LRALLSGWLGRVRATAVAAGIGRVLALAFGVYAVVYYPFEIAIVRVALAMFIYSVAGRELAQVTAEEQRRAYSNSEGIWTAPAGYRWVDQGNGVWQLAPIVAPANDRVSPTWL